MRKSNTNRTEKLSLVNIPTKLLSKVNLKKKKGKEENKKEDFTFNELPVFAFKERGQC